MSIRCLRLLAVVSLLAACASPAPIELRDMGSFHLGGREVVLSGKPVREVVFTPGGLPSTLDPNGAYQLEQMYVQYFLPARERGRAPLLFWHGGGLTGVTYETTPDGRPGWAPYPDIFSAEPILLTKAGPFERFRIGQGAGSYSRDVALMKPLPGSQFPIEAYENFTRQMVPRWTSTDAPTIAAYTLLVDRICPCVIVFHSQAGQFAFKVAQARPDKIKALVAVEPGAGGDPAEAAALSGNSHMMMMDRNNLEVADVIQTWLEREGLYH